VVEALRGYVLKRDALRRELLTAEEEAAYRRALLLMVGDKNVF